MSLRAPLRIALPLLLALSACGPTLVRVPVHSGAGTEVFLRHAEKHGRPVERGYQHPVEISDVRIAHVLASFTHEGRDGKRRPTIRTEHVFDLAEGISKALAEAGPGDEVVAVAHVRERRLGLFTDKMVTSFRVYQQGDELIFDFFDIESEVEPAPGKNTSDEYKVPVELPDRPLHARLIPGEAQLHHGERGLSVRWRDPFYRRPVSLKFRDGHATRRTILMEEDAPLAPEAEQAAPPADDAMIQAQAHALDRLDAARQRGEVTEREYQRIRRLILEGRIEESGYGEAP